MAAPGELRIALRPSALMQRYLLFVYLGAVSCMLAAELPAWLLAVASLALIRLGYREWHLHARLDRPDAVVAIEYHTGGEWRVLTRDGALRTMELGSASFAHPWLSVLVLSGAPGRPRTLAVLPDMADATSLRRLRVLLRTGVLPH